MPTATDNPAIFNDQTSDTWIRTGNAQSLLCQQQGFFHKPAISGVKHSIPV
jgi:hypothetical protein